MTFAEIQPMLALALGAIGMSLGLINLARDIHKSREYVTVQAIPVLRRQINADTANVVGIVNSQLEMNSSDNMWRNIGMRTPASVREHLSASEIPNLIGFEVRNNSSHSVYLYSLGLADNEGKNQISRCHI